MLGQRIRKVGRFDMAGKYQNKAVLKLWVKRDENPILLSGRWSWVRKKWKELDTAWDVTKDKE